MKSRSLLLASLALAAMPAIASAAISSSWTPIAGAPAGFQSYDLTVTTNVDWTNQTLHLTLTQGSIYQNTTFGTNDGPPNPVLVGFDGNLAFDTYFSTDQNLAPSFATNSQAAQALNMEWFDTVNGGPVSNARVARVTVTSDAVGSFSGLAFDTLSQGVGTAFGGTIGGTQVPEPASLGVLSLGAVGLMARRRRRA